MIKRLEKHKGKIFGLMPLLSLLVRGILVAAVFQALIYLKFLNDTLVIF